MAVNALARGWNFETPDVNNLLSPIQAGVQDYRRAEQQLVENRRADEQLGMQRTRLGMDQARAQREDDAARVARLGREANAIHATQGPQRQAMWRAWTQSNPDVAQHMARFGIDPNDHVKGPQFIATEAGSYDPMAQDKTRAEINRINAATGLSNAQAQYYRSRAQAPLVAPQQPSQPDPLAGAGLDEDGNIVRGGPVPTIPPPPGQPEPAAREAPSFPAPPSNLGSGGLSSPVPGVGVVPDRFSPPMRLGGPMDDIERSMRIDEGRPQGVQVAQAGGGSIPAVPGVRPELMNQAMGRFGRTGMTSPDVPGMVTDAGRNRRVDVPATREMQGQRAFNQVTPEQQDRLMKFRQDQELWTGVYKRPPRAGYYYGEDGREMALTDKNFKGDRESQAVALMNLNKIEEASKKLQSYDYVSRTGLGALNIGEVGQAFADMKQGALGIAYALSGKTVAVAEMKNFIEAYGPTPGDSADRIKNKTERMRQFYQALLTASRGGEGYETAFARAMSATGLKNPDGSPAGAPAAASGGTRPSQNQPNDIRGLSTDELVRRLNGGR